MNKSSRAPASSYLSWGFIRSLATELEWDDFDIAALYHSLRGHSYNAIKKKMKASMSKVMGSTKLIGMQLGVGELSKSGADRSRQISDALRQRAKKPYFTPVVWDESSLAPICRALGLDADALHFLIRLCNGRLGNHGDLAKACGWNRRKVERQIYDILPQLGLSPPSKNVHFPIAQVQALVRSRLSELIVNPAILSEQSKLTCAAPKKTITAKEIGVQEQNILPILILARSHHVQDQTALLWCRWMSGASIAEFLPFFPGESLAAIEKRFYTIRSKLCAPITTERVRDWFGFVDHIRRQAAEGYFDPQVDAYAIPVLANLGLSHFDLKVCIASWQGRKAEDVAKHLSLATVSVRVMQARIARACGGGNAKVYDLAIARHKVAEAYVAWKKSQKPYSVADFIHDFARLYNCEEGGMAMLALKQPNLTNNPGGSLRGLSAPALRLYAAVFPKNRIADLLALSELKRGSRISELWKSATQLFSTFERQSWTCGDTVTSAFIQDAVRQIQARPSR